MLRDALPAAFRKLDPRLLARTPVLLLVELGAVVTTVATVVEPDAFRLTVTVWLWLTLLLATAAEAVAESRGRAQASSLRATQRETTARRIDAPVDTLVSTTGLDRLPTVEVLSTRLTVGDVVVVSAGETIPGDGDVIEGVATVDESAITGESAPVVRESGGDRSAVTGGTVVLSDRIVVRITAEPGQTFLDRMIALVEGSERQRTPNEVALGILLTTLTVVFLLAVVTLAPFASRVGAGQDVVVLVALLVCLVPTTIGALLSAIGIAGMDRLVRRGVLATSGRAVEAAGDVDVLLLDKTGTITFGNRRATALLPVGGTTPDELATAVRLASLGDDTPEGRSILELCPGPDEAPAGAVVIPFTAHTRMSGLDLPAQAGGSGHGGPGHDGTAARELRKGAADAVQRWVRSTGVTDDGADAAELDAVVGEVAAAGATPLVVATRTGKGHARVLGVVRLSDVVKPGLTERFATLRAMGIRTVMVTGDNPVTARAIAAEAGVDDVLAQATPEDKLALIRREQAGGRLVAMTGDGTNDAPALAQSDVGVAMASGTAAAKEAGNMVDLDSDPTKLVEIVEIGKQLLITRGALTTFSIANDVAKYFAILPAMFAGTLPQLGALDIMRLSSPQSAIVSAVIFNALIIAALVPLALRGVRYRPLGAATLLRRNLLVYGVGGVIAPFVGIKLIDLLVSLLPGF
nr:potassium-transporting ATPase subunit KdpB [Sanguibacter sp. HDW7]